MVENLEKAENYPLGKKKYITAPAPTLPLGVLPADLCAWDLTGSPAGGRGASTAAGTRDCILHVCVQQAGSRERGESP